LHQAIKVSQDSMSTTNSGEEAYTACKYCFSGYTREFDLC